jgi:hypothetical protein
MPLTSRLGLRPISPVEEDLQRLFDEVLAGFAQEESPQPPDRDLENIYKGYTDQYAHDNNHLSTPSQPSESHGVIAKLVSKFILFSPT